MSGFMTRSFVHLSALAGALVTGHLLTTTSAAASTTAGIVASDSAIDAIEAIALGATDEPKDFAADGKKKKKKIKGKKKKKKDKKKSKKKKKKKKKKSSSSSSSSSSGDFEVTSQMGFSPPETAPRYLVQSLLNSGPLSQSYAASTDGVDLYTATAYWLHPKKDNGKWNYNKIRWDHLRGWLQSRPAGAPVMIDWERGLLDVLYTEDPNSDLFKDRLNKARRIMEMCHEELSPETEYGFYSLLPQRRYWTHPDSWRERNDLINELLGETQRAFFISIYDFYTDEGPKDQVYVEEMVAEAIRLRGDRNIRIIAGLLDCHHQGGNDPDGWIPTPEFAQHVQWAADAGADTFFYWTAKTWFNYQPSDFHEQRQALWSMNFQRRGATMPDDFEAANTLRQSLADAYHADNLEAISEALP